MKYDLTSNSNNETTLLRTIFAPVQSSYNSSEPLEALENGVVPNYVVAKLHRHKDSDVKNSSKFEYFYKYFRYFCNA